MRNQTKAKMRAKASLGGKKSARIREMKRHAERKAAEEQPELRREAVDGESGEIWHVSHAQIEVIFSALDRASEEDVEAGKLRNQLASGR